MSKATLIGHVQDVSGPRVSATLTSETVAGLAFVRGQGYRVGQVGSFVRIPVGYASLYGIVSQMGASAVPERAVGENPFGVRWMTLQLVGETQVGRGFVRGLSQYPTVGDEVHLVAEDDLALLYGTTDEREYISIGRVASADSIRASLNVNRLVMRHSAVLGATGTGKSTTVARVVSALANPAVYPASRVLLLDVHGEYASIFGALANVFRVGQDAGEGESQLCVPYWAMTFDELLPLTLGALEPSPRGAVSDMIVAMKRDSLAACPREGISEDTVTVDSPVPFSIHEFWLELHTLINATHYVSGAAQEEMTRAYEMGADELPVQPGDADEVIPPRFRTATQAAGEEKIYLSASALNIRRQVDALASRLRDRRLDFLFRPGPWMPQVEGEVEQDLDSLLMSWVGGERPITVLDLSGVPSSILDTVVGALLRVIYDALFWSRGLDEGGRQRPLLVVLEEAHAYLREGSAGQASSAVQRIVKEGRKYGIGAMIVSQRPSEIDTTILSQCGTLIALRLSNASDRAHVTAAVSDALEGLLAMLPILRTGEVIAVGEAFELPVRAVVDLPGEGIPESRDPVVIDAEGAKGWGNAGRSGDYAGVVRAWRSQDSSAAAAAEGGGVNDG